MQFFVNNGGDHYIRCRGSSTAGNNNLLILSQNDMRFSSGASETERLRITSAGDVGISTLTPASKLHLYDAASDGLIVQSPSGLGYVWAIQANDNLANGTLAGELGIRGTNGVAISGNNGSACQVHINSNGLCLGGTGAANGLDDYEEGSWTPADGGGIVSFNEAVGRYRKIGNLVVCAMFLRCNNNVTDGGNAYIVGLPFTSANEDAAGHGGFAIGASNVTQLHSAHTNKNSSLFYFYDNNYNNIGRSTMWDGDSTNKRLIAVLTYFTA